MIELLLVEVVTKTTKPFHQPATGVVKSIATGPLSSKNIQTVLKKRRSHVKEEVREVIEEAVVFKVGNKQPEEESAEVKDDF